MRSLCGLISRRRESIDPAWLAAMRDTLIPADGENLAQVIDGAAGFIRGLSPVTSEDAFDRGPFDLLGKRYLFVGIASLTNRDDLVRSLGVTPVLAESWCDSQLLAEAFARWEIACVERLAGLWAFAAWDRHEQVLHVVRDHTSGLEIFYHEAPEFFAFACRARTLAALPPVPCGGNPDRVAQTLLFLRDNASVSPWLGISALAGGHRLRVDATSLRIERYWSLENAPDIRLRSDADYLDRFRELFSHVVAGHLRGIEPIAATLSGGLDSGLVAMTAADLLSRRGQRLRALTSIPNFDVAGLTHPWRIGDEGDMARQTASSLTNVDLTLSAAANVSPVAAVGRVVESSESPDFGVGNSYWLCDIFDAARDGGCGILLNGGYGNFTVSWTGGSFASSWTSWPPSIRTLSQWRRNGAGSLLSGLRKLWIAPLVPPALRVWRAARSPLYTSWRDYSPLNPAWFAQAGFDDRMRAAGHDPLFRDRYWRDGRAEQLAVLMPGRRSAAASWTRLGAPERIDVRDPTSDHRIIEFCLGLPRDQYVRDGTNRWFARRLLAGRLPNSVVWNKRRGLQAADLALRVRDTRDEVAATLDRLAASSLARELLDLPRMREILAATVGPIGPDTGRACDFILLRGISAGLFILSAE